MILDSQSLFLPLPLTSNSYTIILSRLCLLKRSLPLVRCYSSAIHPLYAAASDILFLILLGKIAMLSLPQLCQRAEDYFRHILIRFVQKLRMLPTIFFIMIRSHLQLNLASFCCGCIRLSFAGCTCDSS